MKKAKAYRLSHLSIILSQTFKTIAHDNISHQMDLHDISAQFTENRLFEVFQTLLNDEREKLILETELQINSLLKERQQKKEKFESEFNRRDFSIQTINAQNLEMRAKLGEVNALIFGRKWKQHMLLQRKDNSIQRIQKQLLLSHQPLAQMKSNISKFKIDLDDLHAQISELIYQYPRTFEKAKSKLNMIFKKSFESDYSIVSKLQSKLNIEKEKYTQQLEAIQQLYTYITNKTPEAFSFDEIGLFQQQIQHYLNKKSKKNAKQVEAQKVKTIVDKRIQEKDDEYKPKLAKQRSLLDKLKSELDNLIKKLNIQMSSGSLIDKKFLAQIEESKIQLRNTQIKTDTLMNQIQSINFSSEPSFV